MPKNFSQLRNELAARDVYVLFHYREADAVAADRVRTYLVEGGKLILLGQGRAVRFDRAHVPGGQDHLHFLQKGDNLYALNRDGTAHDKSHGVQMFNWSIDHIQKTYPDWTIPKDGLIEAMLDRGEKSYLVEANEHGRAPVLVDPKVLNGAVNKASMEDPLT
jgi:hypothetical protein